MKKKISVILILATVLSLLLILTSCGGGSDVPSGMQLVAGGAADGYYFYAPEEWTISNIGDIKSAYASRVDTSSVSFCEIDIAKSLPEGIDASEYFFNEYFNSSLAEFPESAKLEVTLKGENSVFGKEKEEADKALKYTYNYEYSGHKFGFMQILMQKDTRFFIFTYSALLEIRTDEKTYYDFYLEKVQNVINEFRFTEITAEKPSAPEYEKDSDGYIRATEGKLAGFELFVPEAIIPKYSSAIVTAVHDDGSNFTMSESMMTGNMYVDDYLKMRLKELSAFVTDISVTSAPDVDIWAENEDKDENKRIAEAIKFGNADAAWFVEYTFIYNGEKYHVYQIYAIEGSMFAPEGYVFTYTAKEANYSLHLDELQKVIEKVNFR